MTPALLSYETRLLAIVDILGWTNLIKQSDESSTSDRTWLLSRLEEGTLGLQRPGWLGEALKRTLGVDGLRHHHFSDTFVVSAPVERSIHFMIAVASACRGLLHDGHYTRGAIVLGRVRHTATSVYGPALVEAHRLESEVAKYPRVILTEAARNAVEQKAAPKDRHSDVCRDWDGLWFLRLWSYTDRDHSRREKLRQRLLASLERDKANLGLCAKHGWMLSALEAFERERVPAARGKARRARASKAAIR